MYDREKSLAIVTGIVCGLVFLAGTVLGAMHSCAELGALGLLSVACYLIADAAIIWAAFIDYNESGTPMEWAAWGVKYLLSAYLLFSGGCIAWLMIENSHTSKAQNSRAELYQKSYAECIAQNGKPLPCRKLAEQLLASETKNDDVVKVTARESAGAITAYVQIPMFKYLPGIFGLIGLCILTLVSKISPQEQNIVQYSIKQARMVSRPAIAPFSVTAYRGNKRLQFDADNGIQSFVLYGQVTGWRVKDESSSYVGHISHKKFDANPPKTYNDVKGML